MIREAGAPLAHHHRTQMCLSRDGVGTAVFSSSLLPQDNALPGSLRTRRKETAP